MRSVMTHAGLIAVVIAGPISDTLIVELIVVNGGNSQDRLVMIYLQIVPSDPSLLARPRLDTSFICMDTKLGQVSLI